MFIQTGGGGKGIRPNQQQQHQQQQQQQQQQQHQQQQQQQQHHQSHHQTLNQTHHSHSSQQSQSQTSHHSHQQQPPQHSHHPHQLQQQQQHHHIHQPSHQAPYYSFQLSQQTASHLPQLHQQQVQNNAVKTPSPPTQNTGGSSGATPSSSLSMGSANNGNSSSNTNLSRQHAASGNNLQHYATHTASAAGAIMQPSSTTAFMTTTYLQQQYHQQSAAVMAAAAAAAQYNTVTGAAGHTAQTQNTNAATQSLYQSQQQQHQQQQQHHQTLHQTHHQPTLRAHYYHPSAGAPTPTPTHMHPHHAHAQQHQLHGILTAPAHQRQPVYLTPANAIFALPSGPLQQQQQRSSLLTAHQQSGATGTPVSVTLQSAAAAARNATGGPTAYITPPFCQPPLPMGATTLTQPPPMLTTAASIATPTLQAYGHMAAAAAAAAAANASTSSTSINTTEIVKTRKHAIPIIHPITHENVMNPKPQKKSASVEAKPSAMECEQSKPATTTTTTVTGTVDKYNESASMHTAEQKLMPTISASKDKIDQQMQTDAIKDKSSNTKINFQANATKTESSSATISTASNLDEEEYYEDLLLYRKQLPKDAVDMLPVADFNPNEEEEFLDEEEEHITVFVEEVNASHEDAINFHDYVEPTSDNINDDNIDRDVDANDAEDMQLEDVETQMMPGQEGTEQELDQHRPELLTLESINIEYDAIPTNKIQVYVLEEQTEQTSELMMPKKLEPYFQHQLKQPSAQLIQKSKSNNNKQNTSNIAPTIAAATATKTQIKQTKTITTTSTTSNAALTTTATILKATPKLSPATSGTSSSTTSTPTHIGMNTTMTTTMQQPQQQLQQQQQKLKTTVLPQVANTKNVVANAAVAAAAVNYNANTTKKNRKGKKGAAAKENQKKLKQLATTAATIETSNRSNSSSSSNYNNNSNTLNNNNNNNNKSSLNNTSLANNNILLLTDINSIRLSNSNISEATAGATTTTVARDTGVTVTTPLGFSTKQQQQQQYKKCNESTNNNLGRGTSTTSMRSLPAEQEYICDNLADDSTPSSTRAASPVLQRKHIKTQEIVAQFLQPPASTKAKTPEELQLQFLNSSASACEDEEDLNARLQLQQQQEEAVAKDLRFGDFNDDREPSHVAPTIAVPPFKFSKGSTSHMGGSKSNDTVDCMLITAPSKSAAALKSFKLSGTTPKTRLTQQPPLQAPLPKNLKYSLEELRALAKCSEARKPPLVSCQKGACIAQLFVPRQQHHHMTQHHHGLNMSPLALQQHLQQQYQHMSFNESIEFVTGKRRGGGGGQAKKHHDHQSVVTQAGVSGGATTTQQQRKPMDVIRVQLSLNEEIKLSECENAWQPETLRSHSSSRHSPAGSNDDIEAVLKKVRGILNKLTPDNFDVLLKTMTSILMNTHEKMQQVMLLIFEKTISEPNFAPTYAKFCKVLFQEFKVDNKPQFSGSLIKRIQEEFESNVNDADAKKLKLQPLVDRLEACEDIKERIELQAELEDQEYQFRRRAWGTVRFIGEMYKLQSLTSDRVLICIESLLKHGCEEKLEYMCKLLTTVGHLLESKTAADQTNSNMRMDKIFRKIQEFVNKSAVRTGPGGSKPVQLKISSRVRFMMQDVMDLRARSWDQMAQPAAQRRSSIYAKSDDKMAQVSGGGGSGGVGSGGLMSGFYEKHSTAASSGRLAYGGGGGGGNQNNARQSRQTASSSSNPNDSNYFMQKPMKFSTQQQQEQQQKQFIDLNKLKFSRGDETTQSNTKLGNSSIYLWRTTGRQAASASMASSNASNATLPLNDTFNPVTNKRQANQFQALDKLDKLEQDALQLPEIMSICNLAVDDSYTAAFTTKEIQKLINRLIEEVLDTHSNSWHAESLNAWQSLNSKQKVALLHHLLTDYLHLASVKRPQRQACAKLFCYLMNDTQFDKQQVFAQAYAQFGEEFPDLLVDVPNGWTYVFEFLGPLLHAHLLNFTDIWLPDWATDAAFTERFLKAFINYFTQEFGANYVYELWHKVYKLEQGQKFFIAGGNSVDRCRNFLTENKFQHIMERGNKGSQEERQLQFKKQGHSLAEQVQRIEYLLDIANDCDLAIDYINTNVHINTLFIRNLTRFFCCDYTTIMSATVAPAAPPAVSTAFASSLLNAELFRSKCIPLLRFCIDANESFEISCLDEIVDSLLRCYDSDSQLANELICSIFDMLYDCEIISKESFEKWYKASSSDGGDMMGGGSGVGVAAAVSEAASQSRQQYQHRQHRLTNKIHAYMAKIL